MSCYCFATPQPSGNLLEAATSLESGGRGCLRAVAGPASCLWLAPRKGKPTAKMATNRPIPKSRANSPLESPPSSIDPPGTLSLRAGRLWTVLDEAETGGAACAKSLFGTAFNLMKPVADKIPINDLPEGANVFGAAVLIFQVIGMFPDVQPQQRVLATT